MHVNFGPGYGRNSSPPARPAPLLNGYDLSVAAANGLLGGKMAALQAAEAQVGQLRLVSVIAAAGCGILTGQFLAAALHIPAPVAWAAGCAVSLLACHGLAAWLRARREGDTVAVMINGGAAILTVAVLILIAYMRVLSQRTQASEKVWCWAIAMVLLEAAVAAVLAGKIDAARAGADRDAPPLVLTRAKALAERVRTDMHDPRRPWWDEAARSWSDMEALEIQRVTGLGERKASAEREYLILSEWLEDIALACPFWSRDCIFAALGERRTLVADTSPGAIRFQRGVLIPTEDRQLRRQLPGGQNSG